MPLTHYNLITTRLIVWAYDFPELREVEPRAIGEREAHDLVLSDIIDRFALFIEFKD